jgi:hypothetical protein
MMTFEEFFLKKKIDLKSLATAKPDLFQEFQTHYLKMGEKSFDHTKKYWFNPLRKDFRLSEDDEIKLKEAYLLIKTEIVESLAQNITTVTDTSLVQGFKPRFKAAIVTAKQEEDIVEPSSTEVKLGEEIVKPIGFKPRFKAASTPAKQDEKVEEPLSTLREEIVKPIGFKPRVKAATTPVKQDEKVEEPSLIEEKPKVEIATPVGFKPRFKPGITPIKKLED